MAEAVMPCDRIRMPGGLLIEVPAGKTIDQAFWRHAVLSISEGMCPLHQVALQPVPSSDGGIGGRCARCLRYWHTLPGGGAEWDTDHDPFTGRPEAPAWVARNSLAAES
jgi:hypothetical protein